MSNNREKRIYKENVNLYLAIMREGTAKDKKCLRQVIKEPKLDLEILEAKCKVFGGNWRIYKTVNSRDCEKARKYLLKYLIDNPDHASTIDTEWRTALLQRECRATDYFMFDVDTEDKEKIELFEFVLEKSQGIMLYKIKSPKGYHYITEKFDTRQLCKLDYVTLLRDGYYYVKTVEKKK